MTVRLKITIAGLAVAALLAGAAGFVLGRYYCDNRKPNFEKEYVLYVRPGMTVEQVMEKLLTLKDIQEALANWEVQ